MCQSQNQHLQNLNQFYNNQVILSHSKRASIVLTFTLMDISGLCFLWPEEPFSSEHITYQASNLDFIYLYNGGLSRFEKMIFSVSSIN